MIALLLATVLVLNAVLIFYILRLRKENKNAMRLIRYYEFSNKAPPLTFDRLLEIIERPAVK